MKLLSFAAAALAATALLGTAEANDLAAYVAPLVRQRDFSGVILVAGPKGTLAEGAFGDASSPDGVYAVGSVSKTFTAAAIELLASRGRLRYSDPLERFVPEYAHAKEITIDELLGHSAGVPDFYAVPAFAAVREKNLSLPEIARWLSAFPLDFKPGTHGRYSNSGYSLLALVVERASREPYNAFLERNVFAPLGLTHTSASASPNDVPGNDPGPPPAYLQPAAKLGNGWLVGNGSIRSNAADLSHWLDVAAAGTFVNFKSLPYPDGWSKKTGSSILQQDGRIPGFASAISIDEATGLKVVVLSSIQCAVVTTMAADLRRAYAGGGRLQVPAARPAYAPALAQLSGDVGRYVLPGLPLVVSLNGSTLLLANANDGMQLPLDPVGPHTFFFRPLYASLSFNTNAAGIAQSINWSGDFTIPRVSASP